MATVATREGQPCFSVQARPDTQGKTLSLAYVQVVDAAGVQVWEAQFQDGTTITPADCISYGLRTEHMTTAMSASPLTARGPYRVVIMAPAAGTPSAPHGYTANFCMTPAGLASTCAAPQR